jgi:hypothetical protein
MDTCGTEWHQCLSFRELHFQYFEDWFEDEHFFLGNTSPKVTNEELVQNWYLLLDIMLPPTKGRDKDTCIMFLKNLLDICAPGPLKLSKKDGWFLNWNELMHQKSQKKDTNTTVLNISFTL